MGSRNLRYMVLQPGQDFLPYFRDRGMSSWAIVCGREGGEAVSQEDE